ncbi:16S rRNA processing protein RimM [Leptospira idonii]|uniref:Ribosome maturation factor RimM n=1 Tax=Leptospira idonii TaxID=1193500 RepID=A0A4R9M225_9LEPT|nr:16S rRNA processing protein RimM [Leptospira idonii]
MQVGTLGATHGIKGFIKVHTGGDSLVSAKLPLVCQVRPLGGGTKEIKITSLKPNGNHLLCKIEGYDSPESVVIFRNASLWLSRSLLPKVDDGEVYVTDLVGLSAVLSLGGEKLDYTVESVIDNPAHPILRFVSNSPKEDFSEILVPFLNLYVGDWNLETGEIEVKSWEDWFAV